jgi:hypothetical protein
VTVDILELMDQCGSGEGLCVCDRKSGMRGVLVIDNAARRVTRLIGDRDHRAEASEFTQSRELREGQVHIGTLKQAVHFHSLVLLVTGGHDVIMATATEGQLQ